LKRGISVLCRLLFLYCEWLPTKIPHLLFFQTIRHQIGFIFMKSRFLEQGFDIKSVPGKFNQKMNWDLDRIQKIVVVITE
jgi:hypothetical protein